MTEKYYCIVLTEDEMTGLKELCHRNRPYLSKYGQMIKDNVIDNNGYNCFEGVYNIFDPIHRKARSRFVAKREIAKSRDAVYAEAEKRIASTGRLSINDPLTQSVPKSDPTIPRSMVEYFAQAYWWKTSDIKRGTNGWIPIKEMHPEHALNAFFYMSTKGTLMYNMWYFKQYQVQSMAHDREKLGYVISSTLAKAVFARSKETA